MKRYVILFAALCLIAVAGCKTPPSNKESEPSIPATPIEDTAVKTPVEEPAVSPEPVPAPVTEEAAKQAAVPPPQPDRKPVIMEPPPKKPQTKPAAKKAPPKTAPAAKPPAKKPAATPKKQDDKAVAAKPPAKKPEATPKKQDDKAVAAKPPAKKPETTPKKQDDKAVAAKPPAKKPEATPKKQEVTPKKQDDKAVAAKPPAKKPAATPKKQDDKAAAAKPPAKKPAATPKKQDDKAVAAKPPAKKPEATPKKQDDKAVAAKPPAKKPEATPKKQDDKAVAAKPPAKKPAATPKKQDDKAVAAKPPAKKPEATPKKQDDKAVAAKPPAKKPETTPKKQDDKAVAAKPPAKKPEATPKKQDDKAVAAKPPAKPAEKPKFPTLPAASAVITDVACLVEQADASFVSKKHTGLGKMYVTVLAKYKGELTEQDFQEAQILSPADTWNINAQTAQNLIEIDKRSKLLLLKHLTSGGGEGAVALGNWDISITLQGQKPFEKRIQVDVIGSSNSDTADRIKRKMQSGQRFYVVPTVMEFNEQPALYMPVIHSASRDNDTIEIMFSIDDPRVKNGYFYFDVPGEQYYRDSGSLIDERGLPVNGCRSFSVDGKQCQYVLRKDDSNKDWFDKAERCFFVVSDINRVAAPGKEQHRSISAAMPVVKK